MSRFRFNIRLVASLLISLICTLGLVEIAAQEDPYHGVIEAVLSRAQAAETAGETTLTLTRREVILVYNFGAGAASLANLDQFPGINLTEDLESPMEVSTAEILRLILNPDQLDLRLAVDLVDAAAGDNRIALTPQVLTVLLTHAGNPVTLAQVQAVFGLDPFTLSIEELSRLLGLEAPYSREGLLAYLQRLRDVDQRVRSRIPSYLPTPSATQESTGYIQPLDGTWHIAMGEISVENCPFSASTIQSMFNGVSEDAPGTLMFSNPVEAMDFLNPGFDVTTIEVTPSNPAVNVYVLDLRFGEMAIDYTYQVVAPDQIIIGVAGLASDECRFSSPGEMTYQD